MNTIPGRRLIEPGDRLPLAPCRLQGKLRRARDAAIDGWSARPCIRQASRPVGDVPQSLEQVRPTEERAGRRLRRARCRQMDKREIEELREKVGCAALLEKDGWKVDVKESTRRAIKYRRDSNIVIVIHHGRGWFDPVVARERRRVFARRTPRCRRFRRSVRSCCGCGWLRSQRTSVAASSKAEGALRPLQSGGDIASSRAPARRAWRYLTGERALPADIVKQAVACGRLREGPQGSMWAAHSDSGGARHRLGGARTGMARLRHRRRQGAFSLRAGRVRADLHHRGGDRCHEPRRDRGPASRHALCQHWRRLVPGDG